MERTVGGHDRSTSQANWTKVHHLLHRKTGPKCIPYFAGKLDQSASSASQTNWTKVHHLLHRQTGPKSITCFTGKLDQSASPTSQQTGPKYICIQKQCTLPFSIPEDAFPFSVYCVKLVICQSAHGRIFSVQSACGNMGL